MYDNTSRDPEAIAIQGVGEAEKVFLKQRFEAIMSLKVRELKAEYIPDQVDLAVKAAIAEELDRKRKLGLPMVFGIDGKVVVMIGDTIVEEKPYESGTMM
jgi:hypothetical protein